MKASAVLGVHTGRRELATSAWPRRPELKLRGYAKKSPPARARAMLQPATAGFAVRSSVHSWRSSGWRSLSTARRPTWAAGAAAHDGPEGG